MTLDEAINSEKEKAKCYQRDYERACAINVPSDGFLKTAKEHEQIVAMLEELKARREADRWVPVTERLPDKEGRCLVFTDYGDVTMDSFVDGLFVLNLGNVTHWKPLPKAPESEDK